MNHVYFFHISVRKKKEIQLNLAEFESIYKTLEKSPSVLNIKFSCQLQTWFYPLFSPALLLHLQETTLLSLAI